MDRIPPLMPVLRRNILNALAAFASVMGASYLYLHLTPPVYEGSTRLILDDRRISVSELGQALATNPTTGNSNPIATQAELVTSERVLARAVALLKQEPTLKAGSLKAVDLKGALSEGAIKSALRVKIVPATNMLELTYRNSNPVWATQVLNAVASAMVQEGGESIRQQASAVREFIETRLPQQQANLDQAELTESQFKEANRIVALESQNTSLVNSLTLVEDQRRATAAQMQESQRKSELLKGVIGAKSVESAYLSSRAGQDDELKALRTKLADLETQVIDARARLGDRHPDLLALLQKRDETSALYTKGLGRIVPVQQPVAAGNIAADDLSRNLIATYITGEVDRSALADRLKVLKSQSDQLNARLTDLPTNQRILAKLMRQREQEAATLKLLQTKLEEARIAEAQLVSNVRVSGLAMVPTEPTSPKRSMILLLGSAAGLALAVGVILLGELLNATIGMPSEVEGQLKIPVVGVLPKRLPQLQPDRIGQFLDDPQAVEPYRRLLKTLELNSGNQLKSILVASCIPGEGKSNVAARLAMVAAMLHRRTLLIDADLSHPLQQQFFNLSDQLGLTNAVSNNLELPAVVQTTAIDRLDVLSHGQGFHRQAQILESKAMKTLIDQATADYDLVIIDTSSIRYYADAMTLNQYTDGMLLVVRPNFTPKSTVLKAIDELQRNGSSILGTVVNATPDPVRSKYFNSIGSNPRPIEAAPDKQPLKYST